ncbi:hypothetical protein GCM10007304_48980 [Rhodococcoides trifolii]|uniref:GH26 domain-containing protein n=1 Tax=Rhodococcoides trifolii TaxID=908250 RepID=A0A917G8X5_9NOCA|nr:hypothetical protein GCM10007304_48980 [Rhodococcus trifolii]
MLALSLIVTSCAANAESPELPMTDGRTWGMSSQGPEQGVAAAVDTSKTLGRKLDVVNFFEAWVWDRDLPTDTLTRIRDAGAMPAITWEPWDPRKDKTQTDFLPSKIAAGDYDDYIGRWAVDADTFDQPMQLRFGHEMNGTWYPWGIGVNGNTAQDYIDAYRHIHQIFMSAGATKVQFVWSYDTSSNRPAGLPNAADAYPGDPYVDVIGIDGYNGGADGSYWQTPEELFAPAIDAAGSIAPGKTLWIYETGSGDTLGDKAHWISSLFAYLKTTRVSGVLWFDYAKPGEADWTLDSSESVTSATRQALSQW